MKNTQLVHRKCNGTVTIVVDLEGTCCDDEGKKKENTMMKKLKGFHYESEKMHGWELGRPPNADPSWVITNDGRRCITSNNVLIKWSLWGTLALMWHPREVLDEDYYQYAPPTMPEDIEFVYEEGS